MRTIAHISDLHFGRIDERVVEGLVTDIAARGPSLVVVSGDLTQRARRRQYRKAAEQLLERLPKPQLVVPGNHDIPLYDLFRRFFFPLQSFRNHITGDLMPVYRDQEILVIGLNTARSFTLSLFGFWKDGRVSFEQLDGLRSATRGVPEPVFKVIVTHHPFIPRAAEFKRDVVHGAGMALAAMEQCGVDLLLAGHLHTGYHGDVRTHHAAVRRCILSVQAGTATSTRRRGMPNSYNWITIEADRVALEVRAWDGAHFMTSTIAEFSRCQTGSGT